MTDSFPAQVVPGAVTSGNIGVSSVASDAARRPYPGPSCSGSPIHYTSRIVHLDADKPAVISPAITEAAAVRDINDVAGDAERTPFTLRPIRIKPRHRCTYGHWPAGVGGARIDVQGIDLVSNAADFRVEEK